MGTYNVSKIEGWLEDFTSAKNKFNNTYYSDYKNSYIRSCGDSAVVRMRNKLNQHYDRVIRINNRIKNVWDDFLYDLKAVDNRLAGGKGSTNDSTVASKLSKLPSLKEYKADLKVRINSASAVVGTVDAIGWSEDKTLEENLNYFGERCAATISTAGVSLVEGVVKLVEDAVDLLALANTVFTSQYTAVIDLSSYIASKITGNDELRTDYTKQIWEKTRAFVSTDYTGQAFDWIYDNTTGGQWMKENAFGFDTVRAIGAEMGEVVGVVLLSIPTGGGAAYMYGAAKIAEHTEENWQDANTSTAEGFFKGALQGVGDGLFFAAGMKGDAVMKSAANAVLKEGGKQTLKKGVILTGKMIYECGCSVAQDGSNIFINAIFSDDVVQTQDGQTIRLDNFGDKLNFYYEQAGGTKGLMTSMATASILSFVSDSVDINQISKNINVNAALKNADINTSGVKKFMNNVNTKNFDVSSTNKIVHVSDNLDSLRKEYDDLLNWKNSEEGLYSKRFYEVYGNRYGSNNKYKKNMDRITELEKKLFNNNNSSTKVSSSVKFNDSNVNNVSNLSKEYNDLLSKSKESWFIQAKEARDNGWAGDLKQMNEVDNVTNINLDENITSNQIINDLETQLKNSNERFNNAVKFDNTSDIAIHFNDKKQYLYQKLKSLADAGDVKCTIKLREIDQPYKYFGNYNIVSCPSADLNEKEIYKFLNKNGYLNKNEIKIYKSLQSSSVYNEAEKTTIFHFTKWSGPSLSAYNRHTSIDFNGNMIDGADSDGMLKYANDCIAAYNKVHGASIPDLKSMDEFNLIMDGIVNKQTLKNDIIVYRTVDDLFFDGNKLDLDSLKPGDVFNDPAHTSTSAKKVKFQENSKRKVQLEICAKEGTPAAYIESCTGVNNYGQQEILFGRNSSFRILGYPKIDANGVYTIKVELIPSSEKNILNNISNTATVKDNIHVTTELPKINLDATAELPKVNLDATLKQGELSADQIEVLDFDSTLKPGQLSVEQVENLSKKMDFDTNMKKYDFPGGYEAFEKDMAPNREMFEKITNQSPIREFFVNYSGENPIEAGTYNAVNGILRGNGIDFDKKTITISTSFGGPQSYSFKEFEKKYGITASDYYKRQVNAAGHMIDTISKIPIGKDMQVVRGANWDALVSYGIKEGDSPDTILKKLQAKGTFTDNGFMSVCPSLSESELPAIVSSKPIRFLMDVDADTRGIDMSEISMSGKHECEMLLQNGLSFIPKSVEEVDGKILIYMIKS